MGNCLTSIRLVCCWCCDSCCEEGESNKVMTRSGQRHNLTEVSSPSQLDVGQLTEVHKVSKLNRKSVNNLLAQYNFQLDKKIGSGAYSTVYDAHLMADRKDLKKGQQVACKIVDISPTIKDYDKRMELVKNELFILEKIQHKHIIRMYEHFIVEDHRLYLFMELASGGDLGLQLEKFGPFKENQCRFWFGQIVDGVSYLHEKKIAHRDLKLQNILLDKEHTTVYITDFGLSQVSFRKEKQGVRKGGIQWSRTYCGTLPYMAPEIQTSNNKPVYYDPFPADVWALGVILFLLFNKNYPFDPESKSMTQMMRRKTLKWNKTIGPPSKSLVRFFDTIFEKDPDLRITIDKIKLHKWLSDIPSTTTTTTDTTTDTPPDSPSPAQS